MGVEVAEEGGLPAREREEGDRCGDAEWRVAFCRAQDTVFALAFAIDWALSVGETRDFGAFRRSIRVLDGRVDRARRALQGVPPRYAGPLVTAELRFLKGLDLMAARFTTLLRTRSPRELPRIRAAAAMAKRGWTDMVRVNQELQQGSHRLICL